MLFTHLNKIQSDKSFFLNKVISGSKGLSYILYIQFTRFEQCLVPTSSVLLLAFQEENGIAVVPLLLTIIEKNMQEQNRGREEGRQRGIGLL